jgi:hypothetical protein
LDLGKRRSPTQIVLWNLPLASNPLCAYMSALETDADDGDGDDGNGDDGNGDDGDDGVRDGDHSTRSTLTCWLATSTLASKLPQT